MRLVVVIGIMKWVVIGLILLGVLVASTTSLASDSAFLGAFVVIFWVYAALASLAAYVVLGWLQQTLLMLVGIAKNTAKSPELDVLSRF